MSQPSIEALLSELKQLDPVDDTARETFLSHCSIYVKKFTDSLFAKKAKDENKTIADVSIETDDVLNALTLEIQSVDYVDMLKLNHVLNLSTGKGSYDGTFARLHQTLSIHFRAQTYVRFIESLKSLDQESELLADVKEKIEPLFADKNQGLHNTVAIARHILSIHDSLDDFQFLPREYSEALVGLLMIFTLEVNPEIIIKKFEINDTLHVATALNELANYFEVMNYLSTLINYLNNTEYLKTKISNNNIIEEDKLFILSKKTKSIIQTTVQTINQRISKESRLVVLEQLKTIDKNNVSAVAQFFFDELPKSELQIELENLIDVVSKLHNKTKREFGGTDEFYKATLELKAETEAQVRPILEKVQTGNLSAASEATITYVNSAKAKFQKVKEAHQKISCNSDTAKNIGFAIADVGIALTGVGLVAMCVHRIYTRNSEAPRFSFFKRCDLAERRKAKFGKRLIDAEMPLQQIEKMQSSR